MARMAQEQNIILNQLWKMQDELYHTYATRSGFSPAAFWILYSLSETDEVYTQNALAEKWCFPKQTVNSAISSLGKMGYIRLEQIATARNSKAVRLTEDGIATCKRILDPLIDAEIRALLRMSEEERELFISLSQRQYDLLKGEISLIYQDKETESV